MKKIILIAAAALLSLSASAQKFAHVNFNELVMLMPAADSARAQIAASQQEAQDTYKSMTDEFQVKYQQYQQKSSTWTPAIRESKEKELQDIQTRIQDFDQSIQQELQQQQQHPGVRRRGGHGLFRDAEDIQGQPLLPARSAHPYRADRGGGEHQGTHQRRDHP